MSVPVHIDGWARVPKASLSETQLDELRRQLTIQPRKVGDHPGEAPGPIYLFSETDGEFSVPRQWFLEHAADRHQISYDVTDGSLDWPGPVEFKGTLDADQESALAMFMGAKASGNLGGILQAQCGWGKTVAALAIIAAFQRPTLVTVHKAFLLRQWKRRIERFLPGAKVGIARQNKCDFKGKHIVLGMNTSLHLRDYDPEFYDYFGLIVSDEVHHVSAPTWSTILPKFRARYRLGLSATPRRADRTESVFFRHIGPVLFQGTIKRLPCRVKRVFNNITLPESLRTNPTLLRTTLATKLICANGLRNETITSNIIRAAQSGRKIIVMSSIRSRHIVPLEAMFRRLWPSDAGPLPTTSFFLGGMSENALEEAQDAQVIFATTQMAKEALDIPQLDTLILTTPAGDIEQIIGRIQRDFPGKKEPMVVDFRDDNIAVCKRLGEYRWKYYLKQGWVNELANS